jgi:hypothetical protein
MLAELDLPKLPDGYRWRFFINGIGNPELNLEKHVAFGKYSSIGYNLPAITVRYEGCTIEEAIVQGAEKLYNEKRRWWEKPEVNEYIKYVGTSN